MKNAHTKKVSQSVFFLLPDPARPPIFLRYLRRVHRLHLPPAGLLVRGLVRPGPAEGGGRQGRPLSLLRPEEEELGEGEGEEEGGPGEEGDGWVGKGAQAEGHAGGFG